MKHIVSNLLLFLLFIFYPSLPQAEDLVVVVNKENTTKSMTKSQVIDLFMGRYVAFPDGNKASPVDSNDENRAQFYKLLIGMSLARVNAYWSRIKFTGRVRPPLMQENTKQVVTYIQSTPNSIGYLPASAVTKDMRIIYRLEVEPDLEK